MQSRYYRLQYTVATAETWGLGDEEATGTQSARDVFKRDAPVREEMEDIKGKDDIEWSFRQGRVADLRNAEVQILDFGLSLLLTGDGDHLSGVVSGDILPD
jgi:hypothetical protein